MIKVKRALLSVFDKTGLLDFARGLQAMGVELITTGGTARLLKGSNIPVQEVSDYTGFPEILDGRVKTLHPKIYGGLLAVRDNPRHLQELKEHTIGFIDMVVVNLYPFERVIAKKNVSLEEALENLDIGGVALLRSGAKNFKSVAVLSNPERYKEILKELDTNSGILSDAVLINLAIEAFQMTSHYDTIIHQFLRDHLKGSGFAHFPEELTLRFLKLQDLRYGENPHQAGAFYREFENFRGLPKMRQLHGKEISFNNVLDFNVAIEIMKDFEDPAAVIVKHTNPTGVAEDKTLARSYQYAWGCDRISSFGGIIGLNHPVDGQTAQLILKGGFMEGIIAPGYVASALKVLKQKKNIRLMELDWAQLIYPEFDFKRVQGGLLFQESDQRKLEPSELKVVTKIKPTSAQLSSLLFGWKVIKNIKSNAIVLVKEKRTVGIGCGQTSRIDSTVEAIRKAGKNAKNAVLVSEAFIPKTDNVKLAAKAGVKAIIQTGGSIADPEVIREADKSKIAMVMTGVRHFKH